MESVSGDMGRRYSAGVDGASWQGAAKEGQALYVEQMSNADILARRERGIDRVSDSQWRSDSKSKGSGRIGGAFRGAIDKQLTNFRPFRNRIEATSLPPRTTDGKQNLIERAGAIVDAMIAEKEAQG